MNNKVQNLTIEKNSKAENIDCNIPNQTVIPEPFSTGILPESPPCHLSDDLECKTKGASNIISTHMIHQSCHQGLKVPVQVPESMNTFSKSPFNFEISTSHINTDITKCLFPQVNDLNVQQQGQPNQTFTLNRTNLCNT